MHYDFVHFSFSPFTLANEMRFVIVPTISFTVFVRLVLIKHLSVTFIDNRICAQTQTLVFGISRVSTFTFTWAFRLAFVFDYQEKCWTLCIVQNVIYKLLKQASERKKNDNMMAQISRKVFERLQKDIVPCASRTIVLERVLLKNRTRYIFLHFFSLCVQVVSCGVSDMLLK